MNRPNNYTLCLMHNAGRKFMIERQLQSAMLIHCLAMTKEHKNIRTTHPRENVFCGVELEQVDSSPYLGVIISNKCKWSAHVFQTAAKANKSLGTIQPLELSKERKRNCIYIPSTTKAGICKCSLGPIFKERCQCSGKDST